MGQFNVQKRKTCIAVVTVTVTVSVIEGRPRDVFRWVIIILLYFLHVIDDIWNNIYVVVVSNL